MLNLFPKVICNNNNNTNATSPIKCSINKNAVMIGNKLETDSFSKTQNLLHFGSYERRNNTSNGRFLKGLKNITDPYSGIKLLTFHEMGKISTDLSQIENNQKRIRYLSKYEKSMLPVEYNIYKLFEYKTRKNRFESFSRILENQKPYCIKNLRQEQNNIFNEIEDVSKSFSPKNKKIIKEELAEARERINRDVEEKHSFKRKYFIDKLIQHQCEDILVEAEKDILSNRKFYALEELANARERFENEPLTQAKDGKTPVDLIIDLKHKYLPDYKDEFKEAIKIARKLPTSNTSVNAFVIKYAGRSDKEIAERLLNQSVGTIEHIEADSLGGDNSPENFMLTSKARNEARGNLPIQAYMNLYPEIPQNTQKYMNDIIKNIYKGKLEGYEWYPYVLKDKLAESGINIDISHYKIPPEKAFESLAPRYKSKYPNYSKYIHESTEPLNIKA